MSNRAEAECTPRARAVVPVIDRNRCEGAADCVRVCPYDVFAIEKLSWSQWADLGMVGRIKTLGHGRRQAFVVNGEQCHACGLCVSACPERAIRLVARPGATASAAAVEERPEP